MNQYAEISTLNHGSYGTVQLVRQLRTSRMYAAKRVSLALSSKAEVEDEIKVHLRVAKHPRVAQLVDHFYDAEANEYVLIIEYCSGGDLHDAIARGEKLGSADIKKIILQLLDTLEYCHSVGVYHRDIKPENIFLQHNGAIRLGDWGLATLDRDCTDFGTGSEHYMAPECFDRSAESYDAAQADTWAAGIVLLNMLFGRTPFKEATERDPLFKDYASSRESLYDIFPALTRDVFEALRHSLALNPENRSIAKMRQAINKIKNWSTDDEIEQIEREKAGSLGVERSPARRVPIVHKPFRVPTAVARSLHTPTHNWDRRKMFTPPSPAPLSAYSHSRSKPGSYKLSMHLPRHLEQPEEEETIPNKARREYCRPGDEDDGDDDLAVPLVDNTKEIDRPSSPSSTSSTSSTSSFTQAIKSDVLDGMFSMDDEGLAEPGAGNLTAALGALGGISSNPASSLPYRARKVTMYR